MPSISFQFVRVLIIGVRDAGTAQLRFKYVTDFRILVRHRMARQKSVFAETYRQYALATLDAKPLQERWFSIEI